MESPRNAASQVAKYLSWEYILGAIILYLTSLAVYRITLHPLARFPGSKFAAITRYYEAYFDLIRNGQYTFRIRDMHRKYGPIIRISPHELHVDDPAFFEQIYRQDGRWDKYGWTVDGFAHPGAGLLTVDHYHHKARRLPVGLFFSKAKVAARHDEIKHHIGRLCNRLDSLASTTKTFNLGAAITATARDISNEFIFGKHYNSIDQDDFEVAMMTAAQGSGQTWLIGKHVTWFGPLLRSVPLSWMMKVANDDMRHFFRHMQVNIDDTKQLMDRANMDNQDPDERRTLVHEILQSKLPASEKTFNRLHEDVTVISGAGFETTSGALRMVFFHVYTNPSILRKLRDELTAAGVQPNTLRDVKLTTLEQLTYLTSVLMEGLRLSPGQASRMARIAPDREIQYDKWSIPRNTPVGMTTILMHTDERVFENPHTFDPERWVDPESRKRLGQSWVPFSKGTRGCVGLHLAWADMYFMVSCLVQSYDFKFYNASAEDFQCISDQFVPGTRSKGFLTASVAPHTTG